MQQALNKYDAIIGLEVHAQLATKSKIWCHCEVSPHGRENANVCEVCSGHPGTLPVLNKRVVEFAAKVALATNGRLNALSYFDRKNYFYPDLPKGYQISQYELPLAQDGFLMILDEAGTQRQVGIERIQIEEDSGKSIHVEGSSLINFNRAGTPLIEIVGKPDIRSPQQASAYLKKLHAVLAYLGVCHGNLQEGNFRCDVNVSLREKGSSKLGTRTETKNLNSFRNVEKAIELEIVRQAEILDRGEQVAQQTLHFDAEKMISIVLRDKSDAQDYRYFPEPDLVPVVISESESAKWRGELPEMPEAKAARFVKDYAIPGYDADLLTGHLALANYFEDAAKKFKGDAKKVSNWIMVEFLGLLNEFNVEVENAPVSPLEMANLLNAVYDGRISGKQAKAVFLKMFCNELRAEAVIAEMGLVLITDVGVLESIARRIIDENPNEVKQFLAGKERILGHFVGLMMQETKGQANPQTASELMKKMMNEIKNK